MWYQLGDLLSTPIPRATAAPGAAFDSAPCCTNSGTVGQGISNAADIVANTTVTRSYRFPGGAFNTAFDIAGPASTVTVVRPTAGITIETWLYTEAPTASNPAALLVTGNNTANEAYSLYIDTNFKLRCAINTPSTFVEAEAPTALVASTIYQAACTYNGVDVILYVNGSAVTTVAATGAITYVGAYGTTVAGPTTNDGVSQNFQGVLAQLAIYATPLPSARILLHYTVGAGATPPTPPPTPSPSPSPSPSPTPTCATYMCFTNATDYPTTYTPFASTSVWNAPVCNTANSNCATNPTYVSNSSSIIATQFPSGSNGTTFRANEAGIYDYYHPFFYAQTSDPTITLNCTAYCGSGANAPPATAHIPALARPAGTSGTSCSADCHMDVTEPDGTNITMWAVTAPSGNWGTSGNTTLSAGSISDCLNLSTSPGLIASGAGPTAMNACDHAGFVTAAELVAGTINHALFLVNTCVNGYQYPTSSYPASLLCTSGANGGPPLGGRLWLDLPATTINGVPTCTSSSGQDVTCLQLWEKGILNALHKFGAYMGDGGGCVNGTESQNSVGLCIRLESEEPWYDVYGQGYTSPFAALASQGWTSSTITDVKGTNSGVRWYGNGGNNWNPLGVAGIGSTWGAHAHWLAPCSAQGTC